jgi:hypothetical protein
MATHAATWKHNERRNALRFDTGDAHILPTPPARRPHLRLYQNDNWRPPVKKLSQRDATTDIDVQNEPDS